MTKKNFLLLMVNYLIVALIWLAFHYELYEYSFAGIIVLVWMVLYENKEFLKKD